jgi:hypothetical protein
MVSHGTHQDVRMRFLGGEQGRQIDMCRPTCQEVSLLEVRLKNNSLYIVF